MNTDIQARMKHIIYRYLQSNIFYFSIAQYRRLVMDKVMLVVNIVPREFRRDQIA
ncbi:hypothetical protein [Lentilactobacillus sp. SPB1-3]|uniref:Uncharacterized protein n=1 Tax=Lentilactobacillus terminaliae TaxID=3003483 RepID=A0ACD5DH12_9LACO|nr:hypothetical protein [Lentilactobacillus sp. SPB1-3]MCZ0976904.1 hypothetical protein [Lentilactobacillus sp. SPB1-3]